MAGVTTLTLPPRHDNLGDMRHIQSILDDLSPQYSSRCTLLSAVCMCPVVEHSKIQALWVVSIGSGFFCGPEALHRVYDALEHRGTSLWHDKSVQIFMSAPKDFDDLGGPTSMTTSKRRGGSRSYDLAHSHYHCLLKSGKWQGHLAGMWQSVPNSAQWDRADCEAV